MLLYTLILFSPYTLTSAQSPSPPIPATHQMALAFLDPPTSLNPSPSKRQLKPHRVPRRGDSTELYAFFFLAGCPYKLKENGAQRLTLDTTVYEFFFLQSPHEILGFPHLNTSQYPNCGVIRLHESCSRSQTFQGLQTVNPVVSVHLELVYSQLSFLLFSLCLEQAHRQELYAAAPRDCH
ncbi:uncharacterized protein LDX57_009523 [Aspergillus melleus]|uniref:uncharacterized protein n=1 Tax=Aspergillus melleus TaxID=138277 RepID=UPI001E8CA9D0|nr:uncharacterized protein LDX57_009523 [Aspergillus melleus]KAH8431872.1 hypothetical protein LDX57_009523 [Aspergillus melleus]